MASAVTTQRLPGAVRGRRAESVPATPRRIRVLLADDHPIYRLGLQRVLAEHGDFDVIGEAATGPEAIALVGLLRPDVVVCDLDLPLADGCEVTQNVRRQVPGPAVILLGPVDSADRVVEAVQAGAAGFYRKDVGAAELAAAVRRVGSGEYVIDGRVVEQPAVTRRLLKQLRELGAAREADPPTSPLSARELEVVALMARGKSNKEIARLLTISDQTVKNHISSILRKLGVNDRTQAVVYAMRRGWISVTADDSDTAPDGAIAERPLGSGRTRGASSDAYAPRREIHPEPTFGRVA